MPKRNIDTPAALDPERTKNVQKAVAVKPLPLPEDPLLAQVRKGDGGVVPGLYRDNSGGVYVVIAVVDGTVVFARNDGGAVAQVTFKSVDQFTAKDRGGRPVYHKVKAGK